jgi:hypothetical protein
VPTREAGLTGAALATLARAAAAAGAVKEDPPGSSVLAKVGGVQARIGLAAAATIDLAIERARVFGTDVQRALVLADIARTQAEIGLSVEAGGTFDEALGLARTVADRGFVLLWIADAQLKARLHDSAEATFSEALSSIESSQRYRWKSKLSSMLSRQSRWRNDLPQVYLWGIHRDTTISLIAGSAALRRQLVQVAQSIDDQLRRADMLSAIAMALPD